MHYLCSSLPLSCIVVHKNPGECHLLGNRIQNDERFILLDMIDSAEDLLPLRMPFKLDLLFVDYECCDASLVDFVQQVKQQITIVFIVRKSDDKVRGHVRFPYVFLCDLIEPKGWVRIIELIFQVKEVQEKEVVEQRCLIASEAALFS